MQSVSGSSRRARVLVLLVALVVGLGSVQAFGAGEAGAAEPVPQMYQGPPFADAGPAPTEDKPQSKLWFNDGAWWALMRTSGNGADGNPDVTIHRLLPDHTWQNTGTVVDGRAASTGDALWQGGTLFVASRVTSGTIQAARLSYDAGTQTYAMDAGFPKSVATGSVESVTITRDSLGRLWVTYTDDDQVWVAHSTTDDTTWTAPFPVPVSDNDISSDDISAIVAFSGRIGVMWSDQGSQVMRFAVHQDSSPDASGWTMETALSGTRSADDHVNLKALVEDDQGRVYAAIKTSRGDSSSDSSSDPSIRVLSRSSSGTWTATTAATVGENLTRPQLALDATNRRLYVVMTTESGGDVYYRHAPLGASLSFTPRATLLTWPGASLNNATTAKAPVTAASGLVVLASDDDETDRYYHAELALNGAAADTTAPSTPSGLTATANSSGQVTVSWTASTDDVGVTSYRVTRNGTVVGPTVTGATSFEDTTVAPSSTYSYTVSAVDGAGNRSAESVAVSVTTPAAPVGVPASSFTSSVAGGESPVEVAFTDTSTGSPTSWAWDFGDGSTSTEQHPVHTFVAAGSFVVTLTASNGAGAGAPASQTVTVTEPAGPPPVGGEVVAGASAQAVSTAAVTSV
ncbi:PKD domain-containing protein, partial [Blastococcus sp. SYSU DS0828]